MVHIQGVSKEHSSFSLSPMLTSSLNSMGSTDVRLLTKCAYLMVFEVRTVACDIPSYSYIKTGDSFIGRPKVYLAAVFYSDCIINFARLSLRRSGHLGQQFCLPNMLKYILRWSDSFQRHFGTWKPLVNTSISELQLGHLNVYPPPRTPNRSLHWIKNPDILLNLNRNAASGSGWTEEIRAESSLNSAPSLVIKKALRSFGESQNELFLCQLLDLDGAEVEVGTCNKQKALRRGRARDRHLWARPECRWNEHGRGRLWVRPPQHDVGAPGMQMRRGGGWARPPQQDTGVPGIRMKQNAAAWARPRNGQTKRHSGNGGEGKQRKRNVPGEKFGCKPRIKNGRAQCIGQQEGDWAEVPMLIIELNDSVTGIIL
ncbi:hypothetical protein C8R45DRAFT_944306 [Mycena sanguinolenta]|nr:hypothetical protein C8R45DRAFT_944306 [Mycena sanguinolenta]